MKNVIALLILMISQIAAAHDRVYWVSSSQIMNVETFQKSLQGELQMACNAELDTSSTCRINSFQITGLRPFYNIQGRTTASDERLGLHIIDISLNSQLVRCNVEFLSEKKTINLKDCESQSLKANLFEQIIDVKYKEAGLPG